jgi:hypothetical protein
LKIFLTHDYMCGILKSSVLYSNIIVYVMHVFLVFYNFTKKDKLTNYVEQSPQLVKKLPTFYGIQKFITMFVNTHYLPLSQARSVMFYYPAVNRYSD